jgi:hypothetical protein
MPVRMTTNKISSSLGRIVVKLNTLPAEGYKKWVSVTPIDTGNARRRTRLQGSKIKADYNYAVPLDQGHSKQAPRGMWEPTKQHLDSLVRRIMRK